MPTGREFSQELKQLMFNVIKFVENEKNGCLIPLNNVNDRLVAILGISLSSVKRLKQEMKEKKNQMIEEEKKIDQVEMEKKNQELQMARRLRHPRTTTDTSSFSPAVNTRVLEIPVAGSPRKLGHAGRPAITLSEQEQENIRYHFHLILAERIYPTTDKVLRRILANDPTFPIHSTTTLWRWMKKLGFVYKRTSKVVVPLDAVSFMAARARYFTDIDVLRSNGSNIFWHDETWCNKNEEKTFIWTDGTTGSGRLRNSEGKGKRLVISALLSDHGFHVPSIDIFDCDDEHTMDSEHFLNWIDHTSFLLREQLGKKAKIVLVLDNATWHNRLTEDTMPPKRAWRKELIIDWLKRHNILIPMKVTKAELLEIAFNNLPEKRFVVDEVAAIYNVNILRLPVKHCIFNPIELAWAGLKQHVRDNNTSFRLSDVRTLTQNWMESLDASTATSYIRHARNIETIFKKSDAFTEQIEEEIVEDDEDGANDFDSNEDDDNNSNDDVDDSSTNSEADDDENHHQNRHHRKNMDIDREISD